MPGPIRHHNLPALDGRRKELRKAGTAAEVRLWMMLKGRQLHRRRFRRQYSIGPYVVDFFCPDEMLAVELDGAVHKDVLRAEYDFSRQSYLEARGIRVLRFENRMVFERMELVLESIVLCFGEAL